MTDYIAHKEEYRGCKLEIAQDTYPVNPWTDEWAVAGVYSDGKTSTIEGANKDLKGTALKILREETLTLELLKKVRDVTGYERLIPIAQDLNPGEYRERGGAKELAADVLTSMLEDPETDLTLDQFKALLDLSKYKNRYLDHVSRGCSQGDYSRVVFLDYKDGEPLDATASEDIGAALAGDAKLYDSYIWGDVYGYRIEYPGGETDSCCGFYGDFPGYGGALAEARESIDEWYAAKASTVLDGLTVEGLTQKLETLAAETAETKIKLALLQNNSCQQEKLGL